MLNVVVWKLTSGCVLVMVDDIGLCGAVCVWLSKEARPWINGRYVGVNWDMEELEAKKDEIVEGELLKFKMAV